MDGEIALRVDGTAHRLTVDARVTLLDVLRELDLQRSGGSGTWPGCGPTTARSATPADLGGRPPRSPPGSAYRWAPRTWLIADVVDLGLLNVHEIAGDRPSMDLLHRVHAGLRNLYGPGPGWQYGQ